MPNVASRILENSQLRGFPGKKFNLEPKMSIIISAQVSHSSNLHSAVVRYFISDGEEKSS